MSRSSLLLLLSPLLLSCCVAAQQNSSSAPVVPPATTTTTTTTTTLASFPALSTLKPDELTGPAAQPSPVTTAAAAADGSCSADAQCVARRGQLSSCVDAVCVCGPRAYEKSGECLPSKDLNEPCESSEECQNTKHAVCTSSVCSCDVGYTNENNVCTLVIPPPMPAIVPMNRDVSGITIKPNFEPDGAYKVLKLKSEELVLECTVTGASVNYTVAWLKNKTAIPDNERFKTVQPNKLVIKKPEENDADTYTCVFSFSNNATASRQEDIPVMVPVYVRLPASTSAVEGEKLQMKCTVFGRPIPTVEWLFGNNSIKEEKGRYQLLEYENVPNAMLQIDDTKMEDRGEYTCIVRNMYSNETSATTMVRVKDKLAALWPFLGICAEVFVLCAIILIYEKKRNKTELEESDTDQSPEQKNTPDHGKDSVRQRK
ncbi:neuroplastin [Bacillus rossius redtenbacheri]|uniref:neuroplastin n=1 Tax=Bacillus rossius redtenbacheri TaxID=93214 RepID=UPI002FDDBE43